jgi:hypothetical protein
MLIKPTLFENFDIFSRVRVILNKGAMKLNILIGLFTVYYLQFNIRLGPESPLDERLKLVSRDKGPKPRQIKL